MNTTLEFKCVTCQCLFTLVGLGLYAQRTGQKLTRMTCPVCGARFTDGKLGQEFHGQQNPPSIREVCVPNVPTASPDDR